MEVTKTDSEKKKSLLLVIEGLALFMAVHAVSGYYIYPKLADFYPNVPRLTMAMLSSAAISLIAILYLAFRSKHFPKYFMDKQYIIPIVVAGAMASWFIFFIEISVFNLNKTLSIIQAILKTSDSSYYNLNVFLYVCWSPLIEETLFRGYFLEMLKGPWGVRFSMLFSSLLFVIPHMKLGGNFVIDFFSVTSFFLFLTSLLLSVVYIRAGLLAAILVHLFEHLYILFINT